MSVFIQGAHPGYDRFVWTEFPTAPVKPVKALKYSEAQPREPAGSPEGGRFAGGNSAGGPEDLSTIDGQMAARDRLRESIGEVIGDPGNVWIEMSPISLKVAHEAEVVLREMKAKGYTMPDSFWAQRDSRTDPHGAVEGFREEFHLYFPATLPDDADPNVAAKVFGGTHDGIKDFAGEATVRDIVIHEMGHIQHTADMRSGGLWQSETAFDVLAHSFNKGSPGNASDIVDSENRVKAAALSVSRYAYSRPREFVAEAFVHMYHGGTLTPDAAKMYRLLNGPKVRG